MLWTSPNGSPKVTPRMSSGSVILRLGAREDRRSANHLIDPENALVEYYKAFAITARLAADDPGNARWWRDLSLIRHEKIDRAINEAQLIGESKTPDYTSGLGEPVGDETAAYFAVAIKAIEKGLSVAELDEAIEDKLVAKAAAREMTTRVTARLA